MLNNPATTAVFIYFVFDFVLLMTARKFNTLILTKDANSNCNISKWIKSIVFLASNKKELNKSLNRNKLKWMVMQCPYNGRFFFLSFSWNHVLYYPMIFIVVTITMFTLTILFSLEGACAERHWEKWDHKQQIKY